MQRLVERGERNSVSTCQSVGEQISDYIAEKGFTPQDEARITEVLLPFVKNRRRLLTGGFYAPVEAFTAEAASRGLTPEQKEAIDLAGARTLRVLEIMQNQLFKLT